MADFPIAGGVAAIIITSSTPIPYTAYETMGIPSHFFITSNAFPWRRTAPHPAISQDFRAPHQAQYVKHKHLQQSSTRIAHSRFEPVKARRSYDQTTLRYPSTCRVSTTTRLNSIPAKRVTTVPVKDRPCPHCHASQRSCQSFMCQKCRL